MSNRPNGDSSETGNKALILGFAYFALFVAFFFVVTALEHRPWQQYRLGLSAKMATLIAAIWVGVAIPPLYNRLAGVKKPAVNKYGYGRGYRLGCVLIGLAFSAAYLAALSNTTLDRETYDRLSRMICCLMPIAILLFKQIYELARGLCRKKWVNVTFLLLGCALIAAAFWAYLC